MRFLNDVINNRTREKYCRNALMLQNNVADLMTKYDTTFLSTFVPSENQNIIVRVRFSNHPSESLEDWVKYEAMGKPNKRVDICFYDADDFDNLNDDVETHVINNKHLYSDLGVKLLQQALTRFFASGEFVNPFCSNNIDDIF